ncbi:MAG: tRNA (N6-isopentenyl adenosine(37)-C2)-methylthiotransferase MiaB [Deltaproteobacteria bacterium]|nr:tRNA (N6-isopentenyl adenosine(37)-C2)-methylthiotransferase MiaB [Deltaproteobacteria bacterium]
MKDPLIAQASSTIPEARQRPGRRFYIHTFGCQMNEADSSRMGEILRREGWTPAGTAQEADLILLNTCAVREKAEQKVMSALGRYRPLKLERGALIGVTGCIAQQEKERLLKKVPYVDFVLGPDGIPKLGEVLRKVQDERARVAETAWVDSEQYLFPRADPETSRGRVTEFVTVMKGCDHVCSYCVVPQVRGRELSRPVAEVMAEVRSLAAVGVREVTFLGQNVNSYQGGASFAELLRQACAVESLARVRFTTSNPHDLPDELVDSFGVLPKLMPHFHLPVQSGSDRILERMRRGHTVAHYLERVERLRRGRPDIALTTDLIVGFPGETEEDFAATQRLVERARFDNVFSFVYSPRPRTAAALHEQEWGHVPHQTKVERLERLQARIREISLELAQAKLGAEVEVLVEGPSKTDPHKRFGRIPENRVVNFVGEAAPGSLVRVRVERVTPNALFGTERG